MWASYLLCQKHWVVAFMERAQAIQTASWVPLLSGPSGSCQSHGHCSSNEPRMGRVKALADISLWRRGNVHTKSSEAQKFGFLFLFQGLLNTIVTLGITVYLFKGYWYLRNMKIITETMDSRKEKNINFYEGHMYIMTHQYIHSMIILYDNALMKHWTHCYCYLLYEMALKFIQKWHKSDQCWA